MLITFAGAPVRSCVCECVVCVSRDFAMDKRAAKSAQDEIQLYPEFIEMVIVIGGVAAVAA